MSNLIVSMARFSTALALFGVEQLEKTMNIPGGGQDVSKSVDELETTLNSLTDVLAGKMDKKKKETLHSVAKMTEETISRSVDSMEMMDPREVLKASTDFLQKTSDVTATWASKAASAVEKATSAKSEEHAAKSAH